VTQNIDIVDSYDVEYIVILAGDHIYKMDYEMMLREHVDSGADVTVGCLDVPREEAAAFGVMHVDDDRPDHRLSSKSPPIRRACPTTRNVALASMGIYVFSWPFLRDQLRRDAEDPDSEP
jgi:glucose-1-phosphate adenylyltransferase